MDFKNLIFFVIFQLLIFIIYENGNLHHKIFVERTLKLKKLI